MKKPLPVSLLCVAICVLWLAAAVSTPAAADVSEDCISFDYNQAVVKQVSGSWKIVVGSMWLKDFGNKESEAREALRIIKHYKMNSQCFVGRPDPSLEYYLVDGKAPVGSMPGEDAIPFDPANAQVTNIGGRWKIVDGAHWILDFAEKKVEADSALKIIKKYKFSYICFVGRPGASMTYFRVDLPVLHLVMPGLVGRLFVLPTEDCIKFDPDNVRCNRQGDQWLLMEGSMSMLDFGDSRSECFQARRIIKEYGLNSQCFVGRPDASMTYYLANGLAPRGAIAGEDCVSFNPANIQVKQISGRWKIVEGSHWIMDFADKQSEANTALWIIKKYGFTRMCFVGRPDPSMTYFRAEELPLHEDCVRFDYRNLELQQIGGSWKIVEGGHWLLDFGSNKYEAELAMKTIQHYKMNKHCFVGRPDPSMDYWLVDGKAPVSAMAGEDAIEFDPTKIEVKQIKGRWKIVEGDHWILDFGAKYDEAEMALRIIRKYGFSYICFVGRPDPSMTYFRAKRAGLLDLLQRLFK